MFVTALVEMPPFGPDAARRLSEASGLSARHAGERLQVPHRGPAVVGCFPARAPAEAQLAALQAAGFHGLLVGAPWPAAEQARQVVVVGDDLMVETEAGRRIIAGADLPLVVWGARPRPPGAERPRDGASRSRRAPLEARDGFMRLCPAVGAMVQVEEAVAADLDDAAFQRLARAVRRVCPAQAFDDRLLARRTQAQILGPDFSPDTALDLAILLVALARGWQYPQ